MRHYISEYTIGLSNKAKTQCSHWTNEECDFDPLIDILYQVKRITRGNKWEVDPRQYVANLCKEHLIEVAAGDTPEGQIIRDERLRIVTMTGINICGD